MTLGIAIAIGIAAWALLIYAVLSVIRTRSGQDVEVRERRVRAVSPVVTDFAGNVVQMRRRS